MKFPAHLHFYLALFFLLAHSSSATDSSLQVQMPILTFKTIKGKPTQLNLLQSPHAYQIGIDAETGAFSLRNKNKNFLSIEADGNVTFGGGTVRIPSLTVTEAGIVMRNSMPQWRIVYEEQFHDKAQAWNSGTSRGTYPAQ